MTLDRLDGLDTRENIFTDRAVKTLEQSAQGSGLPSLEVFRSCVSLVSRDIVMKLVVFLG